MLVELLVTGDASVVCESVDVVDVSAANAAPHAEAVHITASITFFMELLLVCLSKVKCSGVTWICDFLFGAPL